MITSDTTIIFLILLFFAVVLLAEGAFLYYRDVYAPRTRVNHRLEMLKSGAMAEQIQASLVRNAQQRNRSIGAKILNRLELKLTQAGMSLTAERLLTIMGVATLGIGVALPLVLGFMDMMGSISALLLVVVFAVIVGIVLPLSVIDRKATKRIKKFEEQFPVALDIFVRGLRAGHPVTGALDLLVEEMPDPIGSEFAMVVAEISYGYDLRDALNNLGNRIQTTDIQMFAVSVAIQSETGGNLSDILEGLSRVIRERASMVLKVRAMASEGKMTGYVLGALPLLTFAGIFVSNPSFFLDVMDEPLFLPSFLGLVMLYILGIVSIRRMIDLKV